MLLTQEAFAKINLFLHVLSRRDDGYHEIESLVTFADFGDRLKLDMSKPFGLEIDGLFAQDCGDMEGNSVLKAARALQLRLPKVKLGAFTLEKTLPVAAGLGGGSADAAAALWALVRGNDLYMDENIIDAALHVGADVPACIQSISVITRGIGEKMTPFKVPACAAVLVNCGKPLLTRDVFTKYFAKENRKPAVFGKPPRNFSALITLLKETANDLAETARTLCPEIAQVERALAQSNAALVRLSGSGATVFGLYENIRAARAAAQILQQNEPQWWIKAVRLGEFD